MTEQHDNPAQDAPEPQKAEPDPKLVQPEVVNRRRIADAISAEVQRLDALATRLEEQKNFEGVAHIVEALASVKARAEVYCIQIEMAAQTAAVASLLGAAMRQPGQPPGQPPGPRDAGLRSIIEKGKRPPGGDSQ